MSSFTSATISTPRIRDDNQKAKPAPIPNEQRKENLTQREKLQEDIDDAVQEWFDNTMAKAAELAARFNKKPRHFLDIFFSGGARMVTNQEKVNPHNAFVSLKAQELREEGQTISLVEIQRKFEGEYNALGSDERDNLVKDFKENVQPSRRQKIRRPSPRGRIQDFANTVRNMTRLINGLKTRVGVEGFFCLVRNTPSYHVKPQWFFTSEALADYMRIAVAKRWDAHEIGMKVEAFAIAGCDPISEYTLRCC
ncbi:hypothetical protein BJ912DRAFT_852597 [Pholiota molesta]|nr:hypothetical protein BJ912DRAFT_852597 [Pholiota molesta]